MQKSSKIALLVCLLLLVVLGASYLMARTGEPTFTQEKALAIIHHLEEGVASKNVGEIMSQIDSSPETRLANINSDQLRLLLSRAFRAMNHPKATTSNLNFAAGDKGEATVEFELLITQNGENYTARDFQGHVTLHLKRVEISYLFGLYKTREWRIVGGSTTGPQPSEFGDL